VAGGAPPSSPSLAPSAAPNWYDDAADPEPVPSAFPAYSSMQQPPPGRSALASPVVSAAARGWLDSPVAASARSGNWFDDAADPEPVSYFPGITQGI
jgi:hypothetical protein